MSRTTLNQYTKRALSSVMAGAHAAPLYRRSLERCALAAAISLTAMWAGIGMANAGPVGDPVQVLGKDANGKFNVETGAVNGSDGSLSEYQGSNFSGGDHGEQGWGQVLQSSGNPYLTDQMTVQRTSVKSMTITMHTMFDGNEQIDNNPLDNVHYADLFITERPSTTTDTPNTNWAYGVALGGGLDGSTTCQKISTCEGGQQLDGGAAAGVYKLGDANPADNSGDYKTSDQIWTGRSGFVFGGDVALTTTVNGTGEDAKSIGFDPPTRIVAPSTTNKYDTTSLLSSLSVGVTRSAVDNGFYTLSVTLTDNSPIAGASLNTLFTNFDVFWGTADCSNDAIWGSATQARLPAPGAFALLGLGLFGLGGLRRKVMAA